MRLVFEIPARTVPGLNAREHWSARAKRVKRERSTACLMARMPAMRFKKLATQVGMEWPKLYPLHITLTRTKPRGPKADSDQIPGACKGIRDGIADALGIDDGDEALATWHYGQEKGPWGVRVEIMDAVEAELVRMERQAARELDEAMGVTK